MPKIGRDFDGSKLDAARKSAGMTRAQLAAVTGIGERRLYDYVVGRKRPTLAVAVRLADALGLKVDDLLGEVAA